MNTIKLTKEPDNRIIIDCKYDATLVSDIKGLHPSQRKWDGECWIVLDDSNQKPEEETNLEYIRRIAAECCDRRGWRLMDYTGIPDEEINVQREADRKAYLDAHVQAVTTVLDKLPQRSLRIIKWGKIIELQLNFYLDDQDLFHELKNACFSIWKSNMITNLDLKTGFGFVFEMAADERIVRKLIEVGTTNFKKHELEVTHEFEDGIAHFIDSTGKHWWGCDFHKFKTEDLDYDHREWEVALTRDRVYCVQNTDRYISICLKDNHTGRIYFGGAFAVAYSKKSQLPKEIKQLHLKEWFAEWANDHLASNDYSPQPWARDTSLRYPSGWMHPADSIVEHYHKFTEVRPWLLDCLGRTEADFSELANQILETKVRLSQEKIEADRANAFDLARSQVLDPAINKDKLNELPRPTSLRSGFLQPDQ